ncbi:Peroxisomal membrane protein PEX13-like [Homarus americanus]|uniref:Peroxisomal membrane protein PEX13 n=2 Tax=Homarus americanus TaxID=6706 RepID=A0A8J5N1S4_HOMAM|nr:Peroxisomal membrane protein PEX13-like [Homarus americanus]
MGGATGPTADDTFIRLAEDSSRQAFQSIESIVHAFGSVSMMLESTYHAVYSSFRAVLGVADHFSRMKSHFAQIFSALAVVRTLRWLYRKLLYLIGLRSQDPSLEAAWRTVGAHSESAAAIITEADIKASKSSWPIVMFLAVVFGGPYLIWRLLSSLAPTIAKNRNWLQGRGEHYAAVAKYNFEAGNRNELTFRAGQALFLAPKDQQPNVRGWLLASNKNQCGLVPANYIKILGLQSGISRPAECQSEVQGGRPLISNASSRIVASRIPDIPTPKFAQHIPHIVDGLSPVSTEYGVKSFSQGNDQRLQNNYGGQLQMNSSPVTSQTPGQEMMLGEGISHKQKPSHFDTQTPCGDDQEPCGDGQEPCGDDKEASGDDNEASGGDEEHKSVW